MFAADQVPQPTPRIGREIGSIIFALNFFGLLSDSANLKALQCTEDPVELEPHRAMS